MVFAARVRLFGSDDLPVTVSDALHRHAEPSALRLDEAGEDDTESLLTVPLPSLPRRRSDSGIVMPRASRHRVAVVGADESGAFERAFQHRLERAIEGRIAVRLSKSAMTTDTGSCGFATVFSSFVAK